ncbi:general transcription factor 3C polypeptide 4-like isoform X2 [Amphiura filiformis]|uniref:general transcription factor 3C polypeptide 4-like isoform X2 n=1 Tax=Amphiura filiformis TaxID=82378 RepID=UPI003B2236DF
MRLLYGKKALNLDPSNLNNSFLFTRSSIQVPPEKLQFDVGLDTKVLHDAYSGIPSKHLQSIELDRTLCPEFVAVPSYNVYKTAKWSPAGCGPCGRCILACLTRDHRLTVYRICSKKNKPIKIAELSSLLHDHVKECDYQLDPSQKPVEFSKRNPEEFFQEYRRRLYMLAAVDMNWSGIFISTSSSEDKPSPAKVRRQDGSSESRYCLLAVIMKSNDIVLWRFDLPVMDSSSENPRLLGVISSKCSTVTSCAWHRPIKNESIYGWLAIGSKEGTISIFKVDSTGIDSPVANHCVDIWTDKDHLSVCQLMWGHTTPADSQTNKPLLVATKGTFTMVFMLDITEQNVSLVHQNHVCGQHAVSITGLDVNANVAVTCSTDGCVQKAVISQNDTGLQIDVELLEPPKPSQIRQCGVSISTGRTYAAVATELCRVAKSADRQTKIFIKPLRSEAEAEAHILSNDGHLCTKLDSLEFFRQITVANYTLPKGLEDLAGDQFWKTPELQNCAYKLKLRRYLLKMKIASVQFTISQRTRGRMHEVSPELQVLLDSTIDDIVCTENQLVLLHIKKALQAWKTVEEAQPQNADHSNVCSLLLMSDVVGMSDLKEENTETKNVVAEILEKYSSHGSTEGQRETCVLCSENIPFSSVNQSSCSKGHQWKRCCLSLQLCQLRQTRKCQHCDAISLQPDEKQDTGWMLGILNNKCLYCDGSLVS